MFKVFFLINCIFLPIVFFLSLQTPQFSFIFFIFSSNFPYSAKDLKFNLKAQVFYLTFFHDLLNLADAEVGACM